MNSAPSYRLTPHDIPAELLDLIFGHIPSEALAPLVRVNSAFYLAAKPHLFRTLRLTPSPCPDALFLVAGPDHILVDVDARGPFALLPSGERRPLFRTAWLTAYTHTLVVEEHRPPACTAFVDSAPPLPRLRVLRSLFDAHGLHTQQSAYAEDYGPCKCLELSFDTLVHDRVFWSWRTWRSMEHLAPPPNLHVKTHILMFENNAQAHPNVTDFYFEPAWIARTTFPLTTVHGEVDDNREPPISDHFIAVLPIVTTPPSSDDAEAMAQALLELAARVGSDPRRRFTSIGGLMDTRSVDIPIPSWWHRIPGHDLGERPTTRDMVHPMLSTVFRLTVEEEAARGQITLPEGEERQAAITKYVDADVGRVAFKSLDEVLKSGELEGVFTPKELKRLVLGVDEAARLRVARNRAPTL